MLEYPEAHVLAAQINETLKGRKVTNVVVNHSPHKLAWFKGDPDGYPALLQGRAIIEANAYRAWSRLISAASTWWSATGPV